MLRNHLIFALRLFLKDSVYSVLNILGLALGITVGIILLLFLQGELTYDQHFAKHKQIYRFTNHLKADGADFNTANTPRELAPILKADLPEVLEYVRFLGYGESMVEYKTQDGVLKQFYEDKIWRADSNMFSMFDHTFFEGDPKSCLEGPGKVVITKTIAQKYFGDEEAVGKLLIFPEGDTRKVTAVISDLPDNTHLKYEILLSHIAPRDWIEEGDATRKSEGFWNPNGYTYLLMPVDYDPNTFYDKFPPIFDKTFGLFAKRINGTVTPKLQPIADIHFNSDLSGDEPVGNINYVYTFAIVGIFIIILACINYMNMATARSVVRTGEMGIRKVLGFSKAELFRNVMLEAILIAFIAMLIAIVLSYVVLELTPFNSWIDKNLSLNFLSNPFLTIGMFTITLLVGVLSGIYPALYIPSVPVVQALKGTFTGDKSGTLLRKGLIVFQFVISLFVIICTVLMDKQIEYMQHKELGFAKDNVLVIEVKDTVTANHMDAIRTELRKNPNILSAATGYGTPGMGFGGQVLWVERDTAMAQQSMTMIWSGPDYIETMGIELVDGRDFNPDSEAEYVMKFIVNETGARELGWGDNAVGKKVKYFHGETFGEVIGVVKDFNFESLHNKIEPLFIVLDESDGGRIHIRIKGEDMKATIADIEEIWTGFDPNHPFEYTFLDQEFAKQYRADQIQLKLISTLSYICIIVSILGLIGLSAFTASRKAKEISIRKVLGASSATIVLLFSKDYVKLILIAFVISVPLANYIIVEWTSKFAYQMSIQWFYFVLPGVLVLTLGLLTVGAQSLRSARANPVEGLRRE
ncbi:FtsX-like permease family protein [Imperialibacter roseus]|uniref:FtsX-like permease family protein n=1 Tax=Imperialibacter roseus TaxID=1324217 RepID=A0ABZ0IY31_9BACT|nr:FtsX-like permease family protein [Imperialibacter roseus]WOK08860.1 FtsX-like permease family protein [Imperialibacter roseus]